MLTVVGDSCGDFFEGARTLGGYSLTWNACQLNTKPCSLQSPIRVSVAGEMGTISLEKVILSKEGRRLTPRAPAVILPRRVFARD